MHALSRGTVCPPPADPLPPTHPRACARCAPRPLAQGAAKLGLSDGSTAIAALLQRNGVLTVANVGDSRCALVRKDGSCVPLSRDHKPNRDDEKARVIAAGGWVVHQGCWRVAGDLAVSRAFGDRHLKRYGVCAEPELTRCTIGPSDAYLLLASDGLWWAPRAAGAPVCRCALGLPRRRSAHSPRATARPCAPAPTRIHARACRDVVKEPACGQVLSKCSSALDGAKALCTLALRRGSGDNISVLIIDLSKFTAQLATPQRGSGGAAAAGGGRGGDSSNGTAHE